MVEKFGTNGGKIWYLTSVDLMRAHARAHAHSNTSQTHAHSVGMCLGFYRPQKVLSWAENQKFKVPEIFGTFAPFFHGVQYCTIGLESPRPLRGRGLYKPPCQYFRAQEITNQVEKYQMRFDS